MIHMGDDEARRLVLEYCDKFGVTLNARQAFGLANYLKYIDRLSIAKADKRYVKPEDDHVFAERYPGVVSLIRDGEKIKAIKLLRDLTGYGLRESKDLVDEYINKYNIPRGGVNKIDIIS